MSHNAGSALTGNNASCKAIAIGNIYVRMSDEVKLDAVEYVKSDMVLSLGTCSTSAFVVAKLGALLKSGELTNIVGVPTSKRTQEQGAWLNIPLFVLDDNLKLDLAIDGAD
ncbi:hypothetical protein RJ640_002528 [Escallonia rubra]|uniref:ribose-5-phosphate isomerase n=1 Tax=Escallonia rubra TaxID=112253 RepID=A0AA88S2I4_9ASTE|nr:hypothetical protein RJ640_002528 [Escallonia rubra]